MEFRTVYDLDKHERVFSNPGEGLKTEYQLRVVDDEETLVEIGKTDLYEYIQSHADSVDIHKILERCAMLDDYSILNRMPTTFMDVTEMPKNLAEAHSMIVDAKNYFDMMPIDIKEKYNNNYLEFISSLGTEKFEKITGDFLKKIKESEVKTEE